MHIPITKPYITDREYELVREALSSGWLVQGPKVKEFERQVASFAGAGHAVAVNSCTSGQMLMSHILGLGEGDEVLVPAFTWISTANAVEYMGARPVFCDISLDTFNVEPAQLEAKINSSTRALYPVSLFGLAADMPGIMALAQRRRLPVVEDVACGLGSFVEARHCGTFGLAGILSFHPRKSITTGEGGVIITNDEQVARQARSLREHGAVSSDYNRHRGSSSFRMSEYPELGFNMRMTDLQAALGIAQCEKLEEILQIKNQLAEEYRHNLGDLSWLKLPQAPPGYTHSYQTYCTLFKPEEAFDALKKGDVRKLDALHQQRNTVMEALAQKGIMTRPGTHALHIQQLYQIKYGYHKMDFPHAYAADRLSLALPFYPTITREEKDYLFAQIRKMDPSCAE